MPLPPQIQSALAFMEQAAPPSLTKLLASRANGNLGLQRLSLTQDVATSLREIPTGHLKGQRNAVIRPYEIGYTPSAHELLDLTIANDESVEQTILAFNDVSNVGLYGGTTSLEALRFYVFHCQVAGGDTALFFRWTSQKLELEKKFPYSVILGGNTFSKLEQPVLLFDENIDCFSWQGHLYISNLGRFHSIFEYFEQLRERADVTLDLILDRVRIGNPDDFRVACRGQVQMLAKLESIRSKPYIDTLSMERIKISIDTYGLEDKVTLQEGDDGEEELIFEQHPQRRWTILKLLDDDYLTSAMTDQNYEANSKSSIS